MRAISRGQFAVLGEQLDRLDPVLDVPAAPPKAPQILAKPALLRDSSHLPALKRAHTLCPCRHRRKRLYVLSPPRRLESATGNGVRYAHRKRQTAVEAHLLVEQGDGLGRR